jgi:phospholipase/lecithinase/hemolysin
MKSTHLAGMVLNLALFSSVAYAAPFSHVVSYGDSLSDTGNLFGVAGQPGPPAYASGRASNGPLAVELLSSNFGVPLVNNAWAGATTGVGNHLDRNDMLGLRGTPTNFGPLGLPGMRTSFEASAASVSPLAPSALFIVWGGPNDFLSPSPLDTNPIDVANRAVTNIVGIVQALQVLGAQHILVPGLPDLGLTPYGQANGAADASAISAYFNTVLRMSLPSGVRFYDTAALLHRVVNDPAAYGFTNVTGQCIDPSAPNPTPCANPDQFLFWDDFHPTTRAHEILAHEFASAAVPEPATFVLTGCVLVICAAAKRSRSSRIVRARRNVVQ